MAPESKRPKNDNISGLPDSIIGEILSLLPTKQAVATSVLSKRWRYLWTSIKSLDFTFWGGLCKEATFVEFVDRVLSKCTTRELHKFFLRTNYCDSHVHRWVNEAIVRNVQMLELDVNDIPSSVFTCRVLTSLKIEINSAMHFLGLFYYPALGDHSMAHTLESQAPFVISFPLLKRLDIAYTELVENDFKLVIDTPQLEFFRIETMLSYHLQSFVIKNVGSDIKALIYVRDGVGDEEETTCVVEFLKQLNGVKSLTLELETLVVLSNAVPTMLPIFDKLTFLKLDDVQFSGLKIVSGLLQASPSLEVFILAMGSCENDADDAEFDWIQPEYVPRSLISHLRVVELHLLDNPFFPPELVLPMMKYLLGSGEVLRKFVVKTWGGEEFCKKLLTFPRASRYCEIHVSETR